MQAQFVGQIIAWSNPEIPKGWAACNGQLLPIGSWQSLWMLLGTTYGGDGRTTFALPDLRGRMPIGAGEGPGLSSRLRGAKEGYEYHTLTTAELPPHSHQSEIRKMRSTIPFTVSQSNANEVGPKGNYLAVAEQNLYSTDASNDLEETGRTPVKSLTVNNQELHRIGGSQSHNNMQPFQVIQFIIALEGLWPTRT